MFNVNKSSVFTRLALANGIRDRIAGRWITRLASANDIRDRIAGKWITRLALANDVRVGTPGNNRQDSICKGYPCLNDLGEIDKYNCLKISMLDYAKSPGSYK